MAVPGTSMKEVTIIIPYKNTAAFLRKMLSSIFRHKLPFALQVIVINDHSTENLEEYRSVAEEYRHCVEFYDNDSGVHNAGAARNIGLQYAKGDWLLFADADDCFVCGWEKIVYRYLRCNYDIVYFSPISSNDENGSHIRHRKYEKLVKCYLKKPDSKNEVRLRYRYKTPWSKLIRRSLVHKNAITFDEVMFSNDVMFSMKCSFFADTIAACEKPIYCVFYHRNTLTTNKEISTFYARQQVFCNRYAFLKHRLPPNRFRYLRLKQDARHNLENFLAEALCGKYEISEVKKIEKLWRDNKIIIIPSLFRVLLKTGKKLFKKKQLQRLPDVVVIKR